MSCCGRNSSKFYTRQNVGRTCCDNKGENSCCGRKYNDNGCCRRKYDDNNCCGRKYDDNGCCNRRYGYDDYDKDCGCSDVNGLNGISCPFQANNDRCCEKSLRDALCHLTNQRVIIHSDGCKMCVVIVSVGEFFVKTINPCTHRIVYFNIHRIDNVEDVLPRCY